jgi:trehalose/maltose hydrolase-like predicted phosphorylase
MHEPEKAAISYSVRITGGGGKLELIPWLNADVRNEDANYDEKFWENESAPPSMAELSGGGTDTQDSFRGCHCDGKHLHPERQTRERHNRK